MTTSEMPTLPGLRPAFSVTVLECRRGDAGSAFGALRRFLRETLDEPGRAHAVRVLGETVLTDPEADVDGLGPLSTLGFDGLYLAVRQRWQAPRWSADGPVDLTNELTLALRRNRLVALHTSVTSPLLRNWTRERATPYRFLPANVLDRFDGDAPGAVDAAPAWSRLTSTARLDFRGYLAAVTETLDLLDKALVAEDTPDQFE
jgi:hypothetical protein